MLGSIVLKILFLAPLSSAMAMPSDQNCAPKIQIPRAIFIADRHSNAEGKRKLNDRLVQFREQGITHLAMEMFDPVSQPALDAYFQRRLGDEALRSELTRFWAWYPDDYLAVARAARDAGIQPLGIDERQRAVLGEALSMPERDQLMVARIGNLLVRDSKARLLVLVGRQHVLALPGSENLYPPGAPRLPELLFKKYGITSSIYSIALGNFEACNPGNR